MCEFYCPVIFSFNIVKCLIKLLPKTLLYRFANVKSELISTHPLEASEKNVSKIIVIIIIINFPL